MKKNKLPILVLIVLLFSLTSLYAQYAAREDAVWARTTTEEMVLDGVLNEASWANAEAIQINYGKQELLPWTQWFPDGNGGVGMPVDSTHATVKFLVKGNNLYLAFDAPDQSVFGSRGWANWDGLLMSVKSRLTESYLEGNVSSPTEYFYTYWYADSDPTFGFPGCPPIFRGTFENEFLDTVSHNPDLFDGFWKVDGIANDSLADIGWVAEVMISLDTLGIDVTQPGGDIIEMNFSIWDKDDFGDPLASYTNVSGWQTCWNSNDNPGRIHASPDVTVDSGTLPNIDPDFIIPNGEQQAEIIIDGILDEDVWSGAYSFDLGWDSAIRENYTNAGPYRSGRWQYELDLDGDGTLDPRAFVTDKSFANIKIFYKENYLYCAADINDQLIQGVNANKENMFDGITFRFLHRTEMQGQNMPNPREFGIYFDETGVMAPLNHLIDAINNNYAEAAISLKGSSIVNDQTALDEGYIVEMKLDMVELLGYDPDLGDKLIFGGVLLKDGDMFESDPLSSYGTIAWWYGERGNWSVAWGVLDPEMVVGVEDNIESIPNSIELFGNYPNPFNPVTKIKFSVPASGNAHLKVYNVLGQEIKDMLLKDINAGTHEFNFDAANLASGIYFYKVSFNSYKSNKSYESTTSKMILMK